MKVKSETLVLESISHSGVLWRTQAMFLWSEKELKGLQINLGLKRSRRIGSSLTMPGGVVIEFNKDWLPMFS